MTPARPLVRLAPAAPCRAAVTRPRVGVGHRLALFLALALLPGGAAAQGPLEGEWEFATRIWFDRGDDPLLERGERVRIYYRASHDAYIAVFHLDTNGTVRLVYPRSPEENHYVPGGRDFRLVFPDSEFWRVMDDPGVGYFFSVASPEPFDFRDFRYSPYAGGWDLSEVGRQVFDDPYLAMDAFVARLIPEWEVVPYALDLASYHIEQRYDYPRFLCYDCHGFRPWQSWNPYLSSCTHVRVVVHADPRDYPTTRVRGAELVYARPLPPGTPRFTFKERAVGEPSTPLVIERGAVPRGGSVGTPPGREAPRFQLRAAPPAGAGAGEGRGAVPLPARDRPTSVLPRSGAGAAPPPASPERSTRPTLERRPATPPARSTSPTAAPPRRGGGGASTSAPPARSTPPTTSPPRRGGGASAGPPPAGRPPVRSAPPTRRGGGGGAEREAAAPAPPGGIRTQGPTPARSPGD